MGLLGVTLAAILDEEAGNSMSHGVSIYRNYLIVRGWTEGLDLAGFCQLPSAHHVHTHTHPGAQRPNVGAAMALQILSVLCCNWTDFIPLRKMLPNAYC